MKVEKIFDLSNKVVVLTGAAGLLGSQFADGLCQARANVVLADIDYSKCKKIANILEKKHGVSTLAVNLDVSNERSVDSMVKKTIKKFSKIDILINNAIFRESKKGRTVPLEEFPLSNWNKVISVNLTGTFLCCQKIGKIMLKQKNGVIVNISSIYGLQAADQRIYGNSGINSSVVYAVTKSSILNLTRYLASYWNRKGIRVNTLTLGGVEDNQDSHFIKNYAYKTMIGRMARNDEYVGALLFLVSESSSYMTGSNLIIDGGWTAW